jgi:hypothetical protein
LAQPGGRELFGASWKGEGPLPLTGVAPQSQPLQGMLLRPSTDMCPKDLARDMRGFFNSLLVNRLPSWLAPLLQARIIPKEDRRLHRVDPEGGMSGVDEGVLLDLDDYAGHEQCDAALFHHPLVADVSACRTGGL